MQASKAKLAQADQDSEKETAAAKVAAVNTQSEHTQTIDELRSVHVKEIEAIQARYKEQLEKVAKETEEVRDSDIHSVLQEELIDFQANQTSKGTDASTGTDELEKQREERGRLLEELQQEIETHRGAASSSEVKVSGLTSELEALKAAFSKAEAATEEAALRQREILEVRDNEMKGMNQVVEDLRNELQKEHEARKQEFDIKMAELERENGEVIKRLQNHHINTVRAMLDDHATKTESTSDGLESYRIEQEEELAFVAEEHKAAMKLLYQRLQDIMTEKRELESSMDQIKAANDTALQVEREKLERAEAELRRVEEATAQKIQAAQEEASRTVGDLDGEIENLEAQYMAENKDKAVVEAELEVALEEVRNLRKVIETFNEDDKGKEQQHAMEIGKLESELERVTQENVRALTSLQERHNELVAQLSEEREAKLKDLQSSLDSSAIKVSEQQERTESVLKELNDLKEKHYRAVGSLESDLADERDKTYELESTNTNLTQELQTAEQDLAMLRKDFDEVMKEKTAQDDAHAKALDGLQSEMDAQNKALERAKQDAADAKSAAEDVEALKSQVSQLTADLQKEKDAVTKLQGELEAAKEGVVKQKELESQHEGLKVELQQEKDSVTRLRDDLEAAKAVGAATEQLESQLEELKPALQREKDHVAKLEEELEVAKADGANKKKLELHLDELNSELHKEKDNAAQLREAIETAKSDAADKQELESQLEALKLELQNQKNESDAEKKDHESQLEVLKLEVQKQKDSIAQLQEQLEAAKADAADKNDLKSQLEAIEQELQDAKSSAAQLREELEAAKDQLKDAQHQADELEELQTQLARDKETISQLTSHLEDAKKIAADSSEAEQLKDDMQHLIMQHAEEIKKLQKKASAASSAAQTHEAEASQLRDQITDLEKDKAKSEKVIEKIDQHRRNAESAKEAAEQEMEELNSALTHQIENSTKETTDANQRCKTLNEQLKAAQDAAAREGARVKELEAQLRASQESLKRARESRPTSNAGGAAGLEQSKWAVSSEGEGPRGTSIQGAVSVPFSISLSLGVEDPEPARQQRCRISIEDM